MFPTDPQLMTTKHPVERREAARRAEHVRTVRASTAKQGSRPRRFRRIFGGPRARGGLPGSPPGAGGRLLHL